MKLLTAAWYIDFNWWLECCHSYMPSSWYIKRDPDKYRKSRHDWYSMHMMGGEPYHFNRGEWE